MQRSALCRSRRELSYEYLLAKFGFDTAENEPPKNLQILLTLQSCERGLATTCWALAVLAAEHEAGNRGERPRSVRPSGAAGANFFGGAVWGVFRENANCGDPPG